MRCNSSRLSQFYHILLGHGLPTTKSDVGRVSHESLIKHTPRYQCNTIDMKPFKAKLYSKPVAVHYTTLVPLSFCRVI